MIWIVKYRFFIQIYDNYLIILLISIFISVVPCVNKPLKNGLVLESELTASYPAIRKMRYLDADNECLFHAPYAHLNNLLKFTTNNIFKVTQQPDACAIHNADNFIIFGIKSMPGNGEMRKVIRNRFTKFRWDGINNLQGSAAYS